MHLFSLLISHIDRYIRYATTESTKNFIFEILETLEMIWTRSILEENISSHCDTYLLCEHISSI